MLSACAEEKKVDAVYTVDFYKENKEERLAKLEECRNNPGELMMTPNCINAGKAKSSLTWSSKERPEVKPLSAEELIKKLEEERE